MHRTPVYPTHRSTDGQMEEEHYDVGTIKAYVAAGQINEAAKLTGDTEENLQELLTATKITVFNGEGTGQTFSLPTFNTTTVLKSKTHTQKGNVVAGVVELTDIRQEHATILGFTPTGNNTAVNVARADSPDEANVKRVNKVKRSYNSNTGHTYEVFVATRYIGPGDTLKLHHGPKVKRQGMISSSSCPLTAKTSTGTTARTIDGMRVSAPDYVATSPACNTILPYFWPFWGSLSPPDHGWLHGSALKTNTLPTHAAAGKEYPLNGRIAAISATADDATTFEHKFGTSFSAKAFYPVELSSLST